MTTTDRTGCPRPDHGGRRTTPGRLGTPDAPVRLRPVGDAAEAVPTEPGRAAVTTRAGVVA